MHGTILLAALMAYHCAQAAAHDAAMLPFKLGLHTFDQQIEQEYKLHVCSRLQKFGLKYPNHNIITLYESLTITSLNELLKQEKLLNKAQLIYTLIQTCPNVIHHFNLAAHESKHKDAPEAWEQFRSTAYTHLRKFNTTELPRLNLSENNKLTQAQMSAYKTWLIVYFAIKQNEYMGKKLP